MPANILVGYATQSGSTQEVALSIAEILRKDGFAVDLQPAGKVRSLAGYQAVVLGAPLYMFRWHKDALHFLSKYQNVLKSMPVAIFALGPFHNKVEELTDARAQLNKELAKYPWLEPVAIEMFVGKFDPARLRFPFSLIGPLKNMPPSDERDWEVIRSWASALPARLQVDRG